MTVVKIKKQKEQNLKKFEFENYENCLEQHNPT